MIPPELTQNFKEFLGNGNDEVEIRFGHFRANQFQSNLLDRSHYLNVLEHLEAMSKKHPEIMRITQDRTIQYDQFGVRKIIGSNGDVSFQEKTALYAFDVEEWGLRFSRSREVDLDPRTIIPKVIRTYRRITYIDTRTTSSFYGFRIDLSRVLTEEVNQYMDGRVLGVPRAREKVSYELELELNDTTRIPKLDRWQMAITTLYGWCINAETKAQIITQPEQILCSETVLRALKRDGHDLLNRPKTLTNLSQITDHAVTLKTDGVNKLLLISPNGAYLYSPPVNVLKVGTFRSDGATIIEGEYIKEERRFYAYDIMSLDGNSLVERPFPERYKILQIVTQDLSQQKFMIRITVKQFLFTDRKIIRDHLKTQKTDGLIFQSLGPYYNNETFKWKPIEQLTVDFYVKDSVPYVIEGNKLIPFGIGRVHIPEALKNSPVDIFECRFIRGQGWLAVRARPDKVTPNSHLVASSNYALIRNAITEENLFSHLD